MENFIVSARKYRPDNFSAVVGQASITATLKNSIKMKHLGHAYLFSGPRGVGKTTCARIFAKTINCFNITAEGEACNHCESCTAFNTHRSYNIHELDAASNNSVDDIRNLTDQVRIPPQVGSYSIYIIDEVHMLSQQAFNAFLKTLEEPPKHAIFILATTEKHKIIPTILSRCQIYDFNRISVEDAVNYLKFIADKESVKYEEDALQVIARNAEGALRDALSIFDQIVSFSGDSITYKAVIENLNILDYDYYFRLTDAILKGDISSSLLLFDEILRKGFDARNFINGYADHLRDLLVCKDHQTIQLLEVGAGIKERYLQQSKNVEVDFLVRSLDICNQADLQFRTSKNQRLTIELALFKMAGLSGDQKKKVDQAEKKPEAEIQVADKETGDVFRHEEETEAKVNSSGNKIPQPAKKEEEKKENPVMPPSENRVVRKTGISIRDSMVKKEEFEEREDEFDDGSDVEIVLEEVEKDHPDDDMLKKAWNDYADSEESIHPRVFSTLKSHQPTFDTDGRIRVVLNTEAQKENFIKNIKPGLIKYFNSRFGIYDYDIQAFVEENNASGKKIYTDQDKFDYLSQKNPDLGKLKTLFNLDFDD